MGRLLRNTIILDLEPYLAVIEDICYKHKKVFFKDLIFAKNKRYPLEYRWKAGQYPEEFISDKPFLSVIAATLMCDLIKFCVIDNPKIKEMMKKNPIETDNVQVSYIPCFSDEYGIIYDYLDTKPTDDEVEEIIDVTNQIVDHVKRYIDTQRVLEIDIESQYFEITMKENIALIRMEEAGYVWKWDIL